MRKITTGTRRPKTRITDLSKIQSTRVFKPDGFVSSYLRPRSNLIHIHIEVRFVVNNLMLSPLCMRSTSIQSHRMGLDETGRLYNIYDLS